MPHKRAKKSTRDANTTAQGYDNAPTSSESLAVASSSSSTPSAPSVGVLAQQPKKKKVAPKDKLNAFGGRKDMGGLSKSVHRILNAGAVREEYHASQKRKREDEDMKVLKTKNAKKALVPLPYESLPAFNRRVEIALRPSIDGAIRASKTAKKNLAAKAKATRKAAQEEVVKAIEAAKTGAADGKGKGKATGVDPLVPPVRPRKEHTATEFAVASQKRSITDVAMAPPALKKAKRGLDAGPSTHDPLPASRMPVNEALKRIMEVEREKAVRLYREMKEKRDKEQREQHA